MFHPIADYPLDDAAGQAQRRMVALLRALAPAEGYNLTAMTSVDIARRVLNGEFQTGFQTPSRVYGSQFITTFPGATLRDL